MAAKEKNILFRKQGYSLIELMVVVALLSILAATVIPVAKVSVKRAKEIELRRNLRIIRSAIDRYKELADSNMIEVKQETEGYPPDLKCLLEGVNLLNQTDSKIRFLRRIPQDPMTNSTDWGLRSYQDDPDSTTWGRQNVFDIYSKSREKALNGTWYKDW
jgi:general secretion pathway protein G